MQSCNDEDANPADCYTAPAPDNLLVHQGSGELFSGVDVYAVPAMTLVSECMTCAPDEYEIAPQSTIAVIARTEPYGFVLLGAQQVTVGNLANVTGTMGPLWSACTQLSCTPPGSSNCRCSSRTFYRALEYLARARVDVAANVSASARPSAPPAPFGDTATALAAPGGTAVIDYNPTRWSTTENPSQYPLFATP
jgi:hypothetical protein